MYQSSDCQSTLFSTKFHRLILIPGLIEYKLGERKFSTWRFFRELCSIKSKAMEKDSEIRERLREKTPLIMSIVIGIALVLAIVIIASLLKLSFLT